MIRFVAPAVLGAAIYLAAVPSSQADNLLSNSAIPLLKPGAAPAQIASTATGPSTSALGTEGLLPLLRPVSYSTSEGASTGMTAPVTADRANGLRYNTVVVKPGDSFLATIVRGGASAADVHRNLAKLSEQIDVRALQPGDKLTLGFISDNKGRHLATLRWNSKRGRSANVVLLPRALQQQQEVGYQQVAAAALPENNTGMVLKTVAVRGSPSLPRVLASLGLPKSVSEQLMMTLSQSRRPPVHGEIVTIAYLMPGNAATDQAPRFSYAAYKGNDGKQHVLRYASYATPAALQNVDVMPAAMVALWDPLPGAKISSPFGWRIHPVFHTRLFHKGVDYEAHAGTPVMATADGLVEDVGWRGNYGNYILIRHSGRLETAYAHLAGFSAAVAAGTMVHRGEVIGYVGMTGVATGPHLYYEVIVDGRQIDPEGWALKQATKNFQTQTAGIN